MPLNQNNSDNASSNKNIKPKRLEHETEDQYQERVLLAKRISTIKHKIIVLSGKGGVGKSTTAINLAISLSLAGKQVGLLDVDLHGPSIPKMLNLENRPIVAKNDTLDPIIFSNELKVMSVGFLLGGDSENAIIWRGPLKWSLIKQFLKDVNWGKLDYLIIDSPPGTGDEPLSICQLIEDLDGAIIVTTPQEVALIDVRKSITFCRKLNLPILGVIENMSGFVCPKCGEITQIFKSGGGEKMAKEMGIPFLGSIPLDPQIVDSGDMGKPFVYQNSQSQISHKFQTILKPILKLSNENIS